MLRSAQSAGDSAKAPASAVQTGPDGRALPPSVVKVESTDFDEFTGSAADLVACGLAAPEQFPGQPGRGKLMASFKADGSPVVQGSPAGSALRIVRCGRERYRIMLRVAEAIRRERYAHDLAATRPDLLSDADRELLRKRAPAWPFPGIERERFDRLTHAQQMELQGLVRYRIERFEETAPPPPEAAARRGHLRLVHSAQGVVHA